MSNWLDKIVRALAGGRPAEVRAALDEAQRAHARVELEPVTRTTDGPCVLVTRVEHVDDDGVVVSRPVVGGAVRPMAIFEPHVMRFTAGGHAYEGVTRALARTRIPGADGSVIFGYRLEVPRTLDVASVPPEEQAVLGRATVREAELRVLARDLPIHGRIEEITSDSAVLRCRNGQGAIAASQQAILVADLSDPIGAIREEVRVVGVRTDPDSSGIIVRVAFHARNERIADAIDAMRRRGAA
jgi:hypothetical protein